MTEQVEDLKKAPGPKPKVSQEQFDALLAKVDTLESVLAKMAHNAGIPNTLFIENGLQHYELQAKDLRKYG